MYKNNIKKKIDNSQLVYSSIGSRSNNDTNINNNNIRKNNGKSIERKIDDIFNSYDYIYKADVNIVTDKEILKKRIVARNKSNLITYDNEYIPISIIRDIYK